MDIISHGLWGGIAFGRKSKKDWWTSFAFGVAPDALSFGVLFVMTFLGLSAQPNWAGGPPDPSFIPQYVHTLYNITHSLVTFAVVFGIVWLVLKRPFMPMLAWVFHIVLDIFTHDINFFPTPYLWPLPFTPVDGVSWGHPYIWYPNVVLLALVYGVWFLVRRRSRHGTD
jgi:hypothetical protein